MQIEEMIEFSLLVRTLLGKNRVCRQVSSLPLSVFLYLKLMPSRILIPVALVRCSGVMMVICSFYRQIDIQYIDRQIVGSLQRGDDGHMQLLQIDRYIQYIVGYINHRQIDRQSLQRGDDGHQSPSSINQSLCFMQILQIDAVVVNPIFF